MALQELVDTVHGNEPGTLGYLVHQGAAGSLPPTAAEQIVFLEIYRDEDAFQAHLHGKPFKQFLKDHEALFVMNFDPSCGPFMEVKTLERVAGFLRKDAAQTA
ncbi:MAG: antibiotic biosynthesis monooxygenase family protein [Xanthomonadales bacterium]|nr:antibiotic biosynthesis monooxygenase family protein [Xanthomonadales bacterium]